MSSASMALTPYAKEAKYEFLRLLRAKSFSLATIGFPISFYLLFGIVATGSHGNDFTAKYLLATYSVFGLVGSSLFGLCSTISNERAQGWLELKQASPMPPAAYLLSKLLTAMAFGVLIFSLLLLCGITMGHVHLAGTQIAKLLATVILGVFPFASMGILMSQLVPPNASVGVVNLVYLPMSFLGGLWFPLDQLPKWIQKLSRVLPTWHLGQLAIHDAGFPTQWSAAAHVLWLAGFSVVCLLISAFLFRRSAAKA